MRFLLDILLSVMALWFAAFVLFITQMSMPPADEAQHANALIALTGGSNRIERGLTLLANGSAPVLFISGVGEKVTQATLLSHMSPAIRAQIAARHAEIVLDYVADTTQTNAVQAANFVQARDYHSIRLITSHYHMPRSMVEFHAALPGVEIYREPVLSDSFVRMKWWTFAAGRRVIWREFNKYLAASLRTLLARL